MSIFTTIGLAIVAYFAVGGLILGLIKYDFELVENIMFWPVIVIQYICEVIDDLREGVKEMRKRWEGMIKLEVEPYCQNYLDFEADVTKPTRMYAADEVVGALGDTIVRCEYRNRCKAVKRYLEQQMKGEQK